MIYSQTTPVVGERRVLSPRTLNHSGLVTQRIAKEGVVREEFVRPSGIGEMIYSEVVPATRERRVLSPRTLSHSDLVTQGRIATEGVVCEEIVRPSAVGQIIYSEALPATQERRVISPRAVDHSEFVTQSRIATEGVVREEFVSPYAQRLEIRRIGRGELVAQGRVVEEELVVPAAREMRPVVETVPFQDRKVLSERPIGREELYSTGNLCLREEVREVPVGPVVDVRQVGVNELMAMPKVKNGVGTEWKADREVVVPGQVRREVPYEEMTRVRPVQGQLSVWPPVRKEVVEIRSDDAPITSLKGETVTVSTTALGTLPSRQAYDAPIYTTSEAPTIISSTLSSRQVNDVPIYREPFEARTVSSIQGSLLSRQVNDVPMYHEAAIYREPFQAQTVSSIQGSLLSRQANDVPLYTVHPSL